MSSAIRIWLLELLFCCAAALSISAGVVAKAKATPERASDSTIHIPDPPLPIGFGNEIAFDTLKFTEPVAIASAPGETNRLFILEKPGRIMVITNLAAPDLNVFLD